LAVGRGLLGWEEVTLLTHPMLIFEVVAEVRLEDGGGRCAGRVEVKHQGQWGTVCDDFWDMKDAAVVCKQLSCGSALKAHDKAYFGAGSGPIWIDVLHCHGNESALSDCMNSRWDQQNCNHGEDAGVTCSGKGSACSPHLGDNSCSGCVEIHDRDQWKTVCDSDFGPKAADVVCRELQCGGALPITGAAHFGEGVSPIWDRELQCVGNESLLVSCPKGSPRDQPCTHVNAVEYTMFRLVNGSTPCDGRVEVQVLGTWGTLCASRWDLSDAHTLCHYLGCGFAESIPRGGHFGRGTGPIWRQLFHCDGTEAHLGQCPVTTLGASLCSHENDASVICSGHEANLTLCNTSLPESVPSAGISEDVGVICWGEWRLGLCAGRVEIYYQHSWGTLGCGEAVGSARFGEGSGEIWLDGVNCSGAEAALWHCPVGSWGQHDCGHKEDAGVVCSEFVTLRLENSDGCSGRLQVFYNGTWGSVCSNSMTPKTVSLACKFLGCGDRGILETRLPYGKISGPAWLDRVECGERNNFFWQCPSTPWNPQSCDDLQDETHITCNGNSELPRSLPSPDREKIRAVGGENGCSGRVEIWHHGSWGTVCDDSWDMQDAEVACRQLGCGPPVSALDEAAFGEGTGPIWLEQVECQGTEPSLQDFWSQPGDSGACQPARRMLPCTALVSRRGPLYQCHGSQDRCVPVPYLSQAWCCPIYVPAMQSPPRTIQLEAEESHCLSSSTSSWEPFSSCSWPSWLCKTQKLGTEVRSFPAVLGEDASWQGQECCEVVSEWYRQSWGDKCVLPAVPYTVPLTV
uniref:SRCR domain-containing protein n=1 Tax=Otus sunia TaxID=257818 RepID=A0A8C8ALF9_9STRI